MDTSALVVIVNYLRPTEGLPKSEWPIDRVERMYYRSYIYLPPDELANTQVVRFDE